MWKDYLEIMMGYKGAKKAAIFRIETKIIVIKSENFIIQASEINDIALGFDDLPMTKALGIRINGDKYYVIKAEQDIMYGTRLEPYYFACVKTQKVILLLLGENKIERLAASKLQKFNMLNIFEPDGRTESNSNTLDKAKSLNTLDLERKDTLQIPTINIESLKAKSEDIEALKLNIITENQKPAIPQFVEELMNLGDHLQYYNY